jgi:hypothetical protein
MSQPPRRDDPDDPLVLIRTLLTHASYRAHGLDRDDLVEGLERHGAALDQLEGATVVFAGLCDAGKSSLLNACLGAPVVPIDLLRPTPVPVVVRAGDGKVLLHRTGDAAGAAPEVRELADVASILTTPPPSLDSRPLVEIGYSPWLRPSSLVLVDTPSSTVGTASSRALLTGLEPDVLVLVSDAGQELSEIELATITAAGKRSMQVVVALTKIDLQPHWRRIHSVDAGHLNAIGASVPILPVSARLYELGRNLHDDRLVNESGVVPLIELLDNSATSARQSFLCRRALDAVEEVRAELATDLRGQRQLLEAPEEAKKLNAKLLADQERMNRLRGPAARWHQQLGDGLERLQLETDYDLRTRMAKLQTDAQEEIDHADPVAIWPVFSARLERLVDAEVNSVFETLAENSLRLAEDVAESFGAESGLAPPELPLSERQVAAEVRLQSHLDEVEIHGGSTINAIRGSAASLSVTALIGRYGALVVSGALVNAVLLPVGAAMTLMLGHQAFKATRESRTAVRRRAAALAVKKYLDGIIPEVNVRMRTDFMNVRLGLRDHFDQAATALAMKIEADLRVTIESLRGSDQERAARIAAMTEELAQLEFLVPYIERARALVAEPAR